MSERENRMAPTVRKPVSAAERDALVEAIGWARFFIHTQMDGMLADPAKRDPYGEGIEIAAETMVTLAKAVAPFAPDQVACQGCAPREFLWGAAGEIAKKAGDLERRGSE